MKSLAMSSLYQAFLQTLGKRVASSSDASEGQTVDFDLRATEPISTNELEQIIEGFYSAAGCSVRAGTTPRSYRVYRGSKIVASVALSNLSQTVMVTVNPW